MKYKFLIAVLVLISFIVINTAHVFAEEAPYRGYTYDEWGNAVPAPNGYLPEALITGSSSGAGDFKKPSDLFVDNKRNELYVADTGNNRIVVLDSNYKMKRILKDFNFNGKAEKLKTPMGIFVSDNDKLYIADKDNARIIISDIEGKVSKIIGAPKSDIIPDDFVYQPEKVVVDKHGRLYVQSFGVFQGIICLDEEGNFINYFGSNKVDVTAKVLVNAVWKKILTKEQKSRMENFVPIEYSNMYIDSDSFIYATVRTSENSREEIKKLNPLGNNILRAAANSGYVFPRNDYGDHPVVYENDSKKDSTFVDINVNEDNFISALDSARGKVFQYDSESNLMFVFGSNGDQMGGFKSPTALERFNGKILVLDSVKNNITSFGITSFGKAVEKALKLYNEGYYQEALGPWKEVLKRDSNYMLAYVGMAKAYFQLGDYANAMKYFKLGNDKKGYSDSFKEYSTDLMRENFTFILIGIIILFVAPKIFRKRKKIVHFLQVRREGTSR